MHLNEDKKLNNDSSTRRKMNFLECVDHKRIIYDQQTIITVLDHKYTKWWKYQWQSSLQFFLIPT